MSNAMCERFVKVPSMRRLSSTIACSVAVSCLLICDHAEARPIRGPAHAHAAFGCRPPPWFRGWQDVAPFVCGSWWGWPRFYGQELGVRHRHRYRDG